jgi:hypothetical protein
MYEFNTTPESRKRIKNLIGKYIDPEINIDEIEITTKFIAVVVDSGVLAVKYTIENGRVVATMSPEFNDNLEVENLTNHLITDGLEKFVIGRNFTAPAARRSKGRRRKGRKTQTRKA